LDTTMRKQTQKTYTWALLQTTGGKEHRFYAEIVFINYWNLSLNFISAILILNIDSHTFSAKVQYILQHNVLFVYYISYQNINNKS
jgi:hypothetical protein